MKTPIYQKLKNLAKEGRHPFHMPGHKRKNVNFISGIENYDITEIVDYDNLHHPEGIIRQSMNELKKIYGTKESWYLINGTTVGILSAISSVCKPGDKILMGRNCHKSVYNIIKILRLKAIYCWPSKENNLDILKDIDSNEQMRIKKILENHPDIKAIVITSPTYEGVVSDIKSLKEISDFYNIPLIVDEAHGAHLIFHEYFPKSAVECGADIVIQSTHKTLPSLTQTALLHLCSDKVSRDKIYEMLSIYESSSPSYILMASAEYGVSYIHNNKEKLQDYVDNLIDFRKKCGQLQYIRLIGKEELCCYDYDNSKLVFSTKNANISGKELFEKLLVDYNIELEMENVFYCIAMTSICDTKEDFDYLFGALLEIDEAIQKEKDNNYEKKEKNYLKKYLECEEEGGRKSNQKNNIKNDIDFNRINKKMEPWEAEEFVGEFVPIKESVNRISKDYIYLYPPGIPILVPGEKIIEEMVENISYYLYNGYNVLGLSEEKIFVLKEEKL